VNYVDREETRQVTSKRRRISERDVKGKEKAIQPKIDQGSKGCLLLFLAFPI